MVAVIRIILVNTPLNAMRLVSFINMNWQLCTSLETTFDPPFFFFVGTTSRTQKKKGYKQNKLNSMEDLRKKAESSQLDIEFDEVETYKAVGDCSANFKNVIGMITRDLLEPYFFYWKN